MKKIVKIVSAMALVAVLGVTMIACGGVQGTYVREETMNGVKVTSTLELKGGGEYVWTESDGSRTESRTGTYKVDGEKITLFNENNEKIEGTISKNEIVIPVSSELKLTFKKK